ncbi:unnamed protein product [Symbiodinium natans]|uniref:Endonuclease/exonuclease/phosphatase domain-containing protein n=1 Tax=Symbiodinium natans TaxID=878477 RepID=A0A812UK53_9DINO|nr:unnamed protein product [Symbiodinium natans]
MPPWFLFLAALVFPSAAQPFDADAFDSDNECHLKDCGFNALQHRSRKSSAEQFQALNSSSPSELRIYQWNPHWQCFYLKSQQVCKERAKSLLNQGLRNMRIDFANVIELVDPSYRPPGGYGVLKATCNAKENALLIYDSSRWKPSSRGGSRASGCITHKDRAFNVQMFESLAGSPLSEVVVVGAHYPHHITVPKLRAALAQVVHSTGVQRTIFIGDTNQEHGDSVDVAQALGMPEMPAIASSPPFVSCCHKVNEGFVWKFDRIITNFGSVTEAGFFEVPSWAAPSMHRAVHAKVRV